jgi:hypothetical protein
MDYLKRALVLDSKFTPAWALLAQAHSVAFSLYGLIPIPLSAWNYMRHRT